MTWIVGLVLGLALLGAMGATPTATTPPAPTPTTADSWWCRPLLPDTGGSRGRITAVPVTTPDDDC